MTRVSYTLEPGGFPRRTQSAGVLPVGERFAGRQAFFQSAGVFAHNETLTWP
jgi:hypothetical protein